MRDTRRPARTGDHNVLTCTEHLRAGAVSALCLFGAVASWAWYSLLRSFGQLNRGKFAVISQFEEQLPAEMFDAEWDALGRGEDPKVYRSFTKREMWIPIIFFVALSASMVAGVTNAAGLWQIH